MFTFSLHINAETVFRCLKYFTNQPVSHPCSVKPTLHHRERK